MKCTNFSMNLILENVMKIENYQYFHSMQSFHDVHTVFSYCDRNEFFAYFRGTDYMSYEQCSCLKYEYRVTFLTTPISPRMLDK